MQCLAGPDQVTTGVLGVLDSELQAEHGLSLGEYEVLVHLSEEPEHSLRMTDLAGRLHLSPSGITRRIDGLERAGLVERRQCPSDRRGSNAVLTDEGLRRARGRGAHPRARRARRTSSTSSARAEIANLAAALSSGRGRPRSRGRRLRRESVPDRSATEPRSTAQRVGRRPASRSARNQRKNNTPRRWPAVDSQFGWPGSRRRDHDAAMSRRARTSPARR